MGFSVDLRHPDAEGHRRLVETVLAELGSVAERRGVGLSSDTRIDEPPTPMSPDLVAVLLAAAAAAGAGDRLLSSGGGHDSMILARAGIPAGMVFVRCRGGVSHSPSEFASSADLATGTEVLRGALYRLAY